jgi:hypothetical protein
MIIIFVVGCRWMIESFMARIFVAAASRDGDFE